MYKCLFVLLLCKSPGRLIWAALNREPVDRVPTYAVSVNGNICDEILGKPPRTAFEVMDELKEQYPDDWTERVIFKFNSLDILKIISSHFY